MAKGKTKDGLEYLWTDKKRTLFGLPLSFTRYYLTESRLITRVGLLTVVEDELDIYRINDRRWNFRWDSGCSAAERSFCSAKT